jgi:beta-phosphoglucomutase
MIKGYIFDLDGVIVDTAKYHYNAWRKLANTLGFDITEEQNENLKGVSRPESLEYILTLGNLHFSDSEKADMAILKNSWYVDSISNMDESELLPGSADLIKEIKNRGLKVSLGSASKNALRILEATSLIKHFDAIIDGTKTTKSKPHPQVFLMGAEALNLDPKECIVFEDSINGIKAANTGGFVSVGVGDEVVLQESDFVIHSLEGITVDSLNKIISQL